jgi:hypothetical protein
MAQQISRPIRGLARVTFRANADMVRDELEQGWTAKAIFERHRDKLGTMSYRQFMRHILLELGPDVGRAAVARSPSPHDPPTPVLAPAVMTEASPLPPRTEYQPRRTFNHDPIERPGDRRRLLGEE